MLRGYIDLDYFLGWWGSEYRYYVDGMGCFEMLRVGDLLMVVWVFYCY